MKRKPKAVALSYDRSLPAPLVVAKGAGMLADRLEQIARECGVPIRRDDALAERLFVIENGQFIPEPFYRAVAEILAFVYRQSEPRRQSKAKKGQS